MSIYVFLGPSFAWEDATRILEATYLPPVRAGDVLAVTRRQATAIVIIDGFFEQVPSVRHKEILYALSLGIPVFGSASMGALRAAELHTFGMQGIGEIFEQFRRGDLEDDDEVAVSHGPRESGYRLLSEAMVNIRAGLQLARARGTISATTFEALLASAKRRHYDERSWRMLRSDGEALGLPENELDALLALVADERPNLKRDDAAKLLRFVAKSREQGIPRHEPGFEFLATEHWELFVAAHSRMPW